MFKPTVILARFLRGVAAAEQALILAISATGVAVAAVTREASITDSLSTASDCIDEGPNRSPQGAASR